METCMLCGEPCAKGAEATLMSATVMIDYGDMGGFEMLAVKQGLPLRLCEEHVKALRKQTHKLRYNM